MCTQSLYNGSRCKLLVVPMVHTCFVRGMASLGYQLTERRTTQVYVRASSSGHGGLGETSELLEAPDVKEETVDIGTPGLQTQSSDCLQGLWVLVEQRGAGAEMPAAFPRLEQEGAEKHVVWPIFVSGASSCPDTRLQGRLDSCSLKPL